jgi:elongation factor Ts
MAEITAELVRELREKTGVGIGKCKEALTEAKGDIELAIANLRKAGMASAVKKEGRETREGQIIAAETATAIGIAEVNAETDFVVRNTHFQEFAKNIVEEIAKTQPSSVEAFLSQKYSKDPSQTIDALRAGIVQTLGENIRIKRLTTVKKEANSSFGIYSHMGGKILVLVEIAGATDQADLARDIAMHVAAESPEFLSANDVPAAIKAREEDIARDQIKGKPENIINKILEGKLKAFYDQVCLISQKYVKNPDITVAELVAQKAKATNKPLAIKSFLRWSIGQEA